MCEIKKQIWRIAERLDMISNQVASDYIELCELLQRMEKERIK